MEENNHQTLLAVLAHPDDETFGTGGTLAMYARRGVSVYLICATRGEVGDVDEKFLRGFSSIAERRENELRCAAEKLGLTGVYFLGYRDSGMPGSPDNNHPQALAAQPLEKVAADVAHYIRQLCPQVVITFDPIGGYHHPDHIAIHNATVRAFEMAGDAQAQVDDQPPYKPQRLYFQTISRKFLRLAVRLIKLTGRDPSHFGRNKDVDLAAIAAVEFPIHMVIDYRPVAKIRDEASACHASQDGSGMGAGVAGSLRRLFFSSETYMQAYPAPTTNKKGTDLFAGVN